jgi:hypothetical protein
MHPARVGPDLTSRDSLGFGFGFGFGVLSFGSLDMTSDA